MKLIISATGPETSATIDPRFGRCSYFIFVDTEDDTVEGFENPALSAPGGAGIQAAQLVSQKGAKVVLTGNIGPNAFNVLDAAGIDVITGLDPAMTVEDAVNKFEAGDLDSTTAPSVGSHFGMGGGRGRGRGRGGGGGGRGGGR